MMPPLMPCALHGPPTLAWLLWERGLAPPTVHSACAHPGILWLFAPDAPAVRWEPWRCPAQAWWLLERCVLALGPCWRHGELTGAWWCGEARYFCAIAPTFAALPAAICEAALLACVWR